MLEPFDQLNTPPSPPAPPKIPMGKAVVINFGIMLGYMALLSLLSPSGQDRELAVMAGSAFLLVAQVGINLLAGLVLIFLKSSKHIGKAMLTAGIVMAVLGFGTCLFIGGVL